MEFGADANDVEPFPGEDGLVVYRGPVDRSITRKTVPGWASSIGMEAFQECEHLESVIIPEGVQRISRDAFEGCSALASVVIPSTVKKIKNSAFAGCTALPSVAIPHGVKTIHRWLFYGCAALKTCSIPQTVTRIKGSAFANSGLEELHLPLNLTKIGDYAFENCTQLKSVVIPLKFNADAEDDMMETVFEGCDSLERVCFFGLSVSEVQMTRLFLQWRSFENITFVFKGKELINAARVFSNTVRTERANPERAGGAFEGAKIQDETFGSPVVIAHYANNAEKRWMAEAVFRIKQAGMRNAPGTSAVLSMMRSSDMVFGAVPVRPPPAEGGGFKE